MNASDLAVCLQREMGSEQTELLRVIHLDERSRLLFNDHAATGTRSFVMPKLRSLMHRALFLGTRSIIIAHNHPSGDPEPSDLDSKFTRRFFDLCDSLDIRLLDHIIVASESYYSFRHQGRL